MKSTNYSYGILKQTEELSKTIDDFRNFFKPDKLPKETTCLSVVNDALSVIGKSLGNNDIELVLNVDDKKKVKTYSRELMHVLINIIKNAKDILIERDLENKKISISTCLDLESVSIFICDNGGGVDKSIINKIIDPYFSTKGEKNGTGLGLYMSKIIIEKHLYGELSVSNTDEGACFNIKLPVRLSKK